MKQQIDSGLKSPEQRQVILRHRSGVAAQVGMKNFTYQ
jgi:hypothetical protein